MNPFRTIIVIAAALASGTVHASSLSQDQLAALSPEQRIDYHIDERLADKRIKPNPTTDDATFLRRAYLDIAGRVPTLEEAEEFYAGAENSRRNLLIDKLLHSEAYVSHFYNFWADILRINARLGINETPPAVEYAYRLWIKKALRENMPYDSFVRELVTARGHYWENGATGYYHRDRGMPLDNMSNTVRIFLGTRLECAQCHDHPFDRWTQMDYYKMAAFSYGMESKGYIHPNREAMRAHMEQARLEVYQHAVGVEEFPVFTKIQELESLMKRLKRSGEWQAYLNGYGLEEEEFISAAKKGMEALTKFEERYRRIKNAEDVLHVRIRYITTKENERTLQLPHDYQYNNADPFDEVAPRTMFGDAVDLNGIEGTTIEAYADWMTSKKNPTFTRVIANRLWKKVFGQGVFEPIDEITEGTTISNPELMAYLEQLMRELNFDMKAYLGVLYKTQAYQRATINEEVVLGAPCYFQGPLLRRMSAEQVWDSFVGQVLPQVDSYSPNLKRQLEMMDRFRLIHESLADIPLEEYMATVEEVGDAMASNLAQQAIVNEERRKAHAEKNQDLFRQRSEQLTQLQRDYAQKITTIGHKRLHQKKSKEDQDVLAAYGMAEMSMSPAGPMSSGDESAPLPVVIQRHKPTLPVVIQRHKPKYPKPPQGLNPDQIRDWREQVGAEYRSYLSLGSNWARASELQSPAPRGHFLREFGQSDREVIENAASKASAPQALTLLNGPMLEALTNRFGTFGSRLHAASSPEEKVTLIFQAMLTRQPTEGERALAQSQIEKYGEQAYEGIVWSLLNTQQFLFVQ